MSKHSNELNQPVGFPLEEWEACVHPPHSVMNGKFCRLEPLEPHHAEPLHEAYTQAKDGRNWTYLPYGPFDELSEYEAWVKSVYASTDPLFYAIIDSKTNKAVGIASYLRIVPHVGVIEVGHIHYTPALQKTPAATEAMYLMMYRAFEELGYRRYEWKCDALNDASRKAARRLGFSFEGVFRQATMYKGRNRDTAWFSIIDREWPMVKRAFTTWLDEQNFDELGQQRKSLWSFMKM